MKSILVKKIAMIGLMAALVFAASMISINIPTPIDKTRLHLGNVLCLLSGILLGPLPGGLAAGIGSVFFDLMNPLYVSSAPFTLVFKFFMAFICGKIAYFNNRQALNLRYNMIGAITGAVCYVILYLSKNLIYDLFFLRLETATALVDLAQKGLVSGINAVLAVVVVVPLATAVRKGLDQAHIRI